MSFKVKEWEVFYVSKNRGELSNAFKVWRELRPAWLSPSGSCQPTIATSSGYFRVSTVNGEVKQSVEQFKRITLHPIKSI